jgi:hypothetical protein
MLPAKLGSEKADKSSVDRSTKDALADLPRRYLRIALTGIVPVFRRKWDQRFESAFLQQPVCLSGEPRGCAGKGPHFGGILRAAGDVRRDVQAANRDSFAPSL